MEDYPIATAVIISTVLAVSIVYTYDRYMLLGGTHPNAKAVCPPGQVVVGIDHDDSDGGPHGIVYAIWVVCQPISSLH